MLINLSNHPLPKWESGQRAAAEGYFGAIEDIAFPQIGPDASLEDVRLIAKEYAEKCGDMLAKAASHKPHAVHLMGEFTFTYQFLKQMESLGIPCVASTTERIVTEDPEDPTKKTTLFRFIQFRPYFTPTAIYNPSRQKTAGCKKRTFHNRT